MTKAADLPALLAVELAMLNFDNIAAAVALVNGGMRGQYCWRLHNLADSENLSGQRRGDLLREINDLCNRKITEHVPVQCHETGWSSYPHH